jgi:hypothetical protein
MEGTGRREKKNCSHNFGTMDNKYTLNAILHLQSLWTVLYLGKARPEA